MKIGFLKFVWSSDTRVAMHQWPRSNFLSLHLTSHPFFWRKIPTTAWRKKIFSWKTSLILEGPLLLWDLIHTSIRPVLSMELSDQSLFTSKKNSFHILLKTSPWIKNNVKLLLAGHPRFFNQLSTGLDVVSMAGEWLTATANTNMFTYEIAPVFILMEHECLRKMREIIGFENGDSILAPGGSINNMYALMIARHKMYPQHKAHGMRAIKGQLIMYTSKHVSNRSTKFRMRENIKFARI